ncbi:MAG: DUF6273 domain-containing protein [Anaerobutyricum hallii]|uniref:DUF6273 domain-containing protein n=1 Tax=Anaerobutyricum hallii TaxID=39488 RepID=UPI0039938055
MTGIFKRTHTEETISTWEEFKNYLKMGEAREFFGENASMEVQVEDFGTVVFDVLDYDKEKLVDKNKKHSVTLAVRDLIFDPMPFSKNENNSWEESDIRKHINSEEFINRFEPEFRELLCKVYKDNGPKGKETIDTFFLPSVEEMKGGYVFFENEKKRVKITPERETNWYWTRSAYRGYACHSWCVHPSGSIRNLNASWAFRFCLACVIAV